jgi:hypothetical protein
MSEHARRTPEPARESTHERGAGPPMSATPAQP